ncbi:fimbrial protein [Providencia rettgeri]|uniref:fimbrial protein n=1 Tax=Providencia rettgeri TaxID=587 RepID=UPI0020117E07
MLGGMLLGCVSGALQAESSNTITYSGTLVALPCTVEPAYENLWVDFGTNLNAQDFYRGRGEYSDREFVFELKDCDTSLGNAITATFSGDATPEGLLRLDSGSQASGIVIGLETLSGQPLLIAGQPVGAKTPLSEGDVTIRLRAYLQATPEALANRNIEPGRFWATLTYQLQYE